MNQFIILTLIINIWCYKMKCNRYKKNACYKVPLYIIKQIINY